MMALLSGALIAGAAPIPATSPSDTLVTIRTTSSTLQFDPSAISVKQGIRLRLRLVNDGTLPHNLVLVRDEADLDALAEAASHAGGDYLPPQRSRLIAWTALASPGQTVETTLTVPPPGEYPFVCFVSGHSLSMVGTLRSLR